MASVGQPEMQSHATGKRLREWTAADRGVVKEKEKKPDEKAEKPEGEGRDK